MGRIRIGISGWRYPPWRGVFYPDRLPQRRELAFASRAFSTIELNGSFYSLQRPERFQSWYDETPADFVFGIKGSRYITHMLRLKGVERALANFFASGVFRLREKIGPFLWQFSPQLRYEPETFEAFFQALPRDLRQARSTASHHDERVAGRCDLDIDDNRPLRHAVEIRHESFQDDAFVDQLRRHGIALVTSDAGRHWACHDDVTADFVYLRLHGSEELYASGYTNDALDRWARRIRAWADGGEPDDARRISARRPPGDGPRDVYCYFDNDAKVRAPVDARTLMRKLGLAAPADDVEADQPDQRAPTAW